MGMLNFLDDKELNKGGAGKFKKCFRGGDLTVQKVTLYRFNSSW